MDTIVYHSRDLDGLASGALGKMFLEQEEKEIELIGYDYGEKFDIRKFNQKDVLIVDVAITDKSGIERMFAIAKGAKSLTWVDHHVSQMEAFAKFVSENKLSVNERDINGHIKKLTVKTDEYNFDYFYSERLSGCEMMFQLFRDSHGYEQVKSAVLLLGQYDTWRNTSDKMFVSDSDWEKTVLPFQWGMRQYGTVLQVYQQLKDLNDWRAGVNINSIIEVGKSIVRYQATIDASNIQRNAFEFDFMGPHGKTYKVVALNGGPFNSNTFKTVYDPMVHDIMMPFVYNGKSEMFTFSMYTTKEDVDILTIAKIMGGGGHKQACGFQVKPEDVEFYQNTIKLVLNYE